MRPSQVREAEARRSVREDTGPGRNKGWWNRECPNYATRIQDGRMRCLGKEWRPKSFWYCRECSPLGDRYKAQETSTAMTITHRHRAR
jgi:hypothetical protein